MDSAVLPTSNGDFASQARELVAGRSPKSRPGPLSFSLSLFFLSRRVVGRALGRGKKEGAEINRATKRCSSIARRSLSQPSCVNLARRSRLAPLPRKTTHEWYLQGVPEEQWLQADGRSSNLLSIKSVGKRIWRDPREAQGVHSLTPQEQDKMYSHKESRRKVLSSAKWGIYP